MKKIETAADELEDEELEEDEDEDEELGKERVKHALTDPSRTIFASAHKRATMETAKYGLVHVEWRVSTALENYDQLTGQLVEEVVKLGARIAERVPNSRGLTLVKSEALDDMRSYALRGTVGPVVTRAQTARVGTDGPVEAHRREVARIEALGKRMLADGASRAAVEAHVRPLYRAASRAMEAAFEELEAAAAKK